MDSFNVKMKLNTSLKTTKNKMLRALHSQAWQHLASACVEKHGGPKEGRRRKEKPVLSVHSMRADTINEHWHGIVQLATY